jgi:hypothetical protein
MHDAGGYDDGAGGLPELPVSNDIFKGFGDNTGTDLVLDWGGAKDVVDLRPFSTDDVSISRRDFDANGTEESLQIVTGPISQVIVAGHFREFRDYTSRSNMQGRIETLIFADTTFTAASGLATATAFSAEAASGTQATLAEAVDQLAEDARALLAAMPEPGTRSGSGEGANERGPKPAGEPAQRHAADTKHAPGAKASDEKKQGTKTMPRHEKQQATKAPREKKHATQATRAAKPRA